MNLETLISQNQQEKTKQELLRGKFSDYRAYVKK